MNPIHKLTLIPALTLSSVLTSAQVSTSDDEDTFTLSPFEVSAADDNGYASNSAMSATRTNESLANIPNSISIMNRELLDDLSATDFFEAVEFTVGADNTYNDNSQIGTPIGSKSGNQVNFRGLPSVRQLKDGFPTYVPNDNYNLDRIEISRGPGGISYGDTDAGGIINLTSKRGQFRKITDFGIKFDEFNGKRYTADINRVLVEDKLAFRLNLLDSLQQQWHENRHVDFSGQAAAVRWKPFEHGKTVIDVTYEQGEQNRGLSHTTLNDQTGAFAYPLGTTPTLDQLRALNLQAIDANSAQSGTQRDGVGTVRIGAPGNSQRYTLLDNTLYNLQSLSNSAADGYLTYRSTATYVGGNGNQVAEKNPNLIPIGPVPASIIPIDQDWAGPSAGVDYDFSVKNISLQHRINDNFDIWFAFNSQDETSRQQLTRNGSGISGANSRAIHIDTNEFLPDPSDPLNPAARIVNPNFGEAFLSSVFRGNEDRHIMDSVRLMGIYNTRIRETDHRFIFSLNHRDETFMDDAFSLALTPEKIADLGHTGVAARLTNNLVNRYTYIHDGNGDVLSVPTGPDYENFYTSRAFYDQSLSTAVFQHLGQFFNNRLRTSIGLSRDKWEQNSSFPAVRDANWQVRFADEAGNQIADGANIPTRLLTENYNTNTSYGAVYTLNSWIDLTASYQTSAIFTDNLGIDLYGNPRAPQTGSGTDLGVRFTLLQNKLFANIIYFDNVGGNVAQNIGDGIRDSINLMNLYLGRPDLLGNLDSRDTTARGTELELIANLSRNWTMKLSYSDQQTKRSNVVPQIRVVIADIADALAGTTPPEEVTDELESVQQYIIDQDEDTLVGNPVQYRASYITRYSFTEGRLKGFAIGTSAKWASGRRRAAFFVGGQEVVPERKNADDFVLNPFIKYTANFDKFRWTAQLNVDNIFNNQIDQGTTFRYPRLTDQRKISLTNSFKF